jgi:hypothetical protein
MGRAVSRGLAPSGSLIRLHDCNRQRFPKSLHEAKRTVPQSVGAARERRFCRPRITDAQEGADFRSDLRFHTTRTREALRDSWLSASRARPFGRHREGSNTRLVLAKVVPKFFRSAATCLTALSNSSLVREESGWT